MSERKAFRYQGMNIAKMKSNILNYIISIFTEQSASNINLLILGYHVRLRENALHEWYFPLKS